MAEFYSARSWEIPPLPWTNLSPPFSHRVAAELAECSAGDQMALDVEEVVDGRMDGEEPLRGRGRFEPLHLSLSSSHRLM